MPDLAQWDSFYVIVGSSAGALIGLQFVVMTLMAERPPTREGPRVSSAFGTPTVVHLSAVLLTAALLRVPWGADGAAAWACAAVGVTGALYALLTAWRMRTQSVYAPDLEDWLCHAGLPLAAYITLCVAAYAALASRAEWAPFGFGGATLLLLFCGIHNAWDAVAFNVLSRAPRDPGTD
jgi:alpha-beta hydrolase superfamily lysophospholipase